MCLPEFKIYKWLRINAFDRLSITFHATSSEGTPQVEEIWRERDEAVDAIKAYFTDLPGKKQKLHTYKFQLLIYNIASVAFIHGPQGSGKTRMLEAVLKDSGRYDSLTTLSFSPPICFTGEPLLLTVGRCTKRRQTRKWLLLWRARLDIGPCSHS